MEAFDLSSEEEEYYLINSKSNINLTGDSETISNRLDKLENIVQEALSIEIERHHKDIKIIYQRISELEDLIIKNNKTESHEKTNDLLDYLEDIWEEFKILCKFQK
jgi:hypothetical protein